jgi:hypothetical protein
MARPDARIIILLRDPVERAFSQFMHHLRDSLEPCETLEEALVGPCRAMSIHHVLTPMLYNSCTTGDCKV